MVHAHKYKRITLEKANGDILEFEFGAPNTEPVFLLRGQDKLASAALNAYAELLTAAGLPEQAVHAFDHANEMRDWSIQKLPD